MGVNTQIFDDGSTLAWSDDYGFVQATPSTDFPVNVNASNWRPGAVSAGAGSWDDVLKFGFSRAIDAKVRGIELQNAIPVRAGYVVNPLRSQHGGSNGFLLLLIGAAVFIAMSK